MPGDPQSLEPLSELSPFVFEPRTRRHERFGDPLAASIAFAAREDFVFTEHELENVEEERDSPQESPAATKQLNLVADEAVKWGVLPADAAAAIKAGNRDEVDLTNKLFFSKHRELSADHKITPAERPLAAEWSKLRTTVIRRVLQSSRMAVVVAPPFLKPPDPGFITDPVFDSCLKRVPLAERLGVALVDVTDPFKPVYAGFHDSTTLFAASVAKLFATYAAFELRARVRDALKTIPTSIPLDAALLAIKNAWQPRLDANKPNNSAAFAGFPDLTSIFTFTAAAGKWTVEFRSKGKLDDIPPKKREGAGEKELGSKFGFLENLTLMTTFSNNVASAKVIAALTFEYINALLVAAGLYVPGKGGLWLAAPYVELRALGDQGKTWMPEPTMRERNVTRRFQVATAKGLATLFTLLAQRRLFDDPRANDQMLDLLKTGINDSIRFDLDTNGRTVADSRTKIGLLPEPVYWGQISLIERKTDGTTIKYVMALLNADLSVGRDETFILPMDDCVASRH